MVLLLLKILLLNSFRKARGWILIFFTGSAAGKTASFVEDSIFQDLKLFTESTLLSVKKSAGTIQQNHHFINKGAGPEATGSF